MAFAGAAEFIKRRKAAIHPAVLLRELMACLDMKWMWVVYYLTRSTCTTLMIYEHMAKKVQLLGARALAIEAELTRVLQVIIKDMSSPFDSPSISTEISSMEAIGTHNRQIESGNEPMSHDAPLLATPGKTQFNGQDIQSPTAAPSANFDVRFTSAWRSVTRLLMVRTLAVTTRLVYQEMNAVSDTYTNFEADVAINDRAFEYLRERDRTTPALALVAEAIHIAGELTPTPGMSAAPGDWIATEFGEGVIPVLAQAHSNYNKQNLTTLCETDKSAFTDILPPHVLGFMASLGPDMKGPNGLYGQMINSVFAAGENFFGEPKRRPIKA
jgi:hypothetical protein